LLIDEFLQFVCGSLCDIPDAVPILS
jgi:hypothetical protein